MNLVSTDAPPLLPRGATLLPVRTRGTGKSGASVAGPHLVFLLLAATVAAGAQSDTLKKSDVIFMYQADRPTYDDYGATVLAWGGTPSPKSLETAAGIAFFGSVGMVTEFARYYERFPENYTNGLCRDLEGHPIKVPWLTDHQHQGIPYWWCCTQQPLFRQFLRERVVQTVKAGAQGIHIDDHLGTAGALFTGACFCDRCLAGFRGFLGALPVGERSQLGGPSLASFDYRDYVRAWLAQPDNRRKGMAQRPLFPLWRQFQCREAARFMIELRQLAAQTAGHSVPVSANAGVLWPLHLADYQALDFFSAEIEHDARQRRFNDRPLMAYRLAEAMNRPLAATASGQDWAFIKEQNLPGLVCGWIATAYAAGNYLMAPHRQWCYTPEKGTHWYQGPREKFAPLYQFVHQNPALFDGFQTFAEVGVLFSHRAFVKNREPWFDACAQLAAANIPFRLLVAGDELVDHPLSIAECRSVPLTLLLEQAEFLPADQDVVHELEQTGRVLRTVMLVTNAVIPSVRAQAPGPVRVLPRVRPGAVAVHLVNGQYDAATDRVRDMAQVRITVNPAPLGIQSGWTCRLYAPEADSQILPAEKNTVTVPKLNLWAVLLWEPQTRTVAVPKNE